LLIACSLMSITLCVQPAMAQSGGDAPSANAAKQAREHFDAGASHFFRKEYGKALVEFQRAFELNPDAMILYNISAAHFRLGNFKEAYVTAQRARSFGGMPDKVIAPTDGRIAGLSVRLQAGELTDAIANARAKAEAANEQSDGTAQTVVAPAPPADDSLGAVGWTGAVMTAAGTGLLLYTLYADLSLGPDLRDYENAAMEGNAADYDYFYDDIKARQQRARLTLYSGSALAAVGMGLWLYDEFDSPEPRESASVQLAPTGDGAMIRLKMIFE
jgi:tetratricopeptide (TPR) repeat protein